MFFSPLVVPGLLAVLVVGQAPTTGAAPATAMAEARLDAATIRAGLRTANRDEEAYITYVVTLVDRGRLLRSLLDSSFQWARRKPVGRKKFQYFKRALILQAARLGVGLPRGTPDLTPTINGRVVVRILFVEVPAPNITVTIRGTKRKTVTDAKGEFSFPDVPFGTYTLDAQGIAAFLPKRGSATVLLPSDPPSADRVFVGIRLR